MFSGEVSTIKPAECPHAFRRTVHMTPAPTTVEIIENLHGCDVDSINRFLELLSPSGCKSALDDFGQENAFYFSSLLEKVDIIKFDRDVFSKAYRHTGYRHLLQGFINFAHSNGQKTVIEGVETLNDLQLAKELGTDYIQGYYFRDRFISHIS